MNAIENKGTLSTNIIETRIQNGQNQPKDHSNEAMG